MRKREKREHKKHDRGIVDFMMVTNHFFHFLREWILEMDDPKIPYAGILIWWLKKHIK